VVARLLPFQRTFEVETKLVPLTVRVKAGSPAVALAGEIAVSVGSGLLIVNVSAFEAPPPGVGVTTVTEAVAALVMSAAPIDAASWVALTNVVVRALPFQFTFELEMKFDPLAVSVNAPPPAVELKGEIADNTGTGFRFAVAATDTTNVEPVLLTTLTLTP
jgi:hypothetical protein